MEPMTLLRGALDQPFGLRCVEAAPAEWARLTGGRFGGSDVVVEGSTLYVRPGRWAKFVAALERAGIATRVGVA